MIPVDLILISLVVEFAKGLYFWERLKSGKAAPKSAPENRGSFSLEIKGGPNRTLIQVPTLAELIGAH